MKTILTAWTLMAVLNPLQALLNAFVYRKWTRVAFCEPCVQFFRRRKRSDEETMTTVEKSPLLKDEPTTYQSVDSVVAAPNENNGHSVNSCSCV